jgi:hypothetical protein
VSGYVNIIFGHDQDCTEELPNQTHGGTMTTAKKTTASKAPTKKAEPVDEHAALASAATAALPAIGRTLGDPDVAAILTHLHDLGYEITATS